MRRPWVHNIAEAQQRVALQAFEEGSIEDACPPLRALLTIMAHGDFEGKDAHHPEIRRLFTREALEASDWYRQRLAAKKRGDERLWRKHLGALDAWLAENDPAAGPLVPLMRRRREYAAAQLERVISPAYLDSLRGTLGTDPSLQSH